MSEQVGVGGTGGTGSEGEQTVRYSVPQMARYLGISERAVRKQIEAGKLFAVKEDRAWVVIVDRSAVPSSVPAAAARPAEAVPRLSQPEPAVSQPDAGARSTTSTASTAPERATGTAGSEPGTAHPVVDDNMGPQDELLTVAHAEPRGTDQDYDAVSGPEPAVLGGTTAVPVPPVDLSPLVNLVAELTRKNADLIEAATVWQFRARHLEEQLKQLTAGDSAEPTMPENDAPAARPAAFDSPPAPDASQSSQGSESRSWWQRLLGGR